MNRKERRRTKKSNNLDPFAWRNGGKKFDLGTGEDGTVSDLINIEGALLCVMEKSVINVRLADEIDPNRTNPGIRDTQQKILAYGSENMFVSRTLLQANELLKGGFLSDSINSEAGLSIAWALTKELAALQDTMTTYLDEEKRLNTTFDGKPANDSSVHLPSMNTVEQKAKQFIINADHAARHLMELAQLFYPEIPSKKWIIHLHNELRKEKGDSHPATEFIKSIMLWVHTLRNTRSAVEHSVNEVIIRNYDATEQGVVVPPTIQYIGQETPFEKILLSLYMESIIEELQTVFENTLACLCDVNLKTSTRGVLGVVETPVESRKQAKKYVRYQIGFLKEI